MNLKNTFKKLNSDLQMIGKNSKSNIQTPHIPEGLLKRCNSCKSPVFTEDVTENNYICPKCGYHFRIHAYHRIEQVADPNTFEEWDQGLILNHSCDHEKYAEKISILKEKTNLDEAVITGKASIGGTTIALGVCDSRFIMASMGEVMGEKITRLVERATKERLPVILFTCSGGARMQEGIHSLMQMAKTAAAFKRHSDEGLLYLSVLTNPTTGGVTASFAMLGDVILAEPNALIGFAGPRVIEQTIGQKLPTGFQTSEFLLEHGFLDAIVERSHLRETLIHLLALHKPYDNNDQIKEEAFPTKISLVDSVQETPPALSAWECVKKSRRKDRPVSSDYIQKLFQGFYEFHGDRYFSDDPAVVGGIAFFQGIPVTVISQEKGKTTKEQMKRNFGMASPEGYRKALRLMKQAEKFHRPIICFVDTPGAFCGIEAEERGQGEAIARNLYEMSSLKTPILSFVLGEGGSGGALALAVSDEVWMMEHAIYSILSPEGYASILWKDSTKAKKAAEAMKLRASDLKKANIVERVFSEPAHYTTESMDTACEQLTEAMCTFLYEYMEMSEQQLIEHRYQRFRKF